MSETRTASLSALGTPEVLRPRPWANRISGLTFLAIHVGCLGAIWTGVTVRAAVLCMVLYWLRMFAITAGYHRYFSHRTYKTSRWFQFVLAWLGCSSIQKGPLWWASKHRHHHKYSDMPEDVHSPLQRGFYYAHIGWILGQEHTATDLRVVRDLAKYPELMFLNKHYWLPPLVMAVFAAWYGGWSGFVVGMGWSTVLCWHWTFAINSLTHIYGNRRYATTDDSRNNWFFAIFTMGEGWHNNHHHYQSAARQGFFWWEYDFSYYILKALSAAGLVWDLKQPPARVYEVQADVGPFVPQLASAARRVVMQVTPVNEPQAVENAL